MCSGMSGSRERLPASFFRDTTALRLARDLLGCVLVRETPEGTIAGYIYETEAYTDTDEASHCYRGRRTPRNEMMFAAGGHLYVYFTYGMHHCANIIAGPEGKGSAVLIRSVRLTDGIDHARRNRTRAGAKPGKRYADTELANGPAKLCQVYEFTREQNGTDLTDPRGSLYILNRTAPPKKVHRTPRIGISRAKEKLWRFVIPD